MPSCGDCLSKNVYSIETNKHVFFHNFFTTQFFSPFKFFCTKRYDNMPTRTPLTGGFECIMSAKNRYFRLVSRFTACRQRIHMVSLVASGGDVETGDELFIRYDTIR